MFTRSPARQARERFWKLIVLAADREDWNLTRSALSEFPGAVSHVMDAAEIPHDASADVLVVHAEDMCGRDVELIRSLRLKHLEIQVVAVCRAADARTVRRAVDAGVGGLVLRKRIEASLASTIAAVLVGQTVVPREYGASLRKPSLSYREKQILGLVVMGYTNSQIGGRLCLAESTVKSHLASSFTKLGVSSRSEAAAFLLDPKEPLGAGVSEIGERLAQLATAIER